MKIRLFPLVLFALTSLLTLKAFDMIFSGEPLLTTATVARAEGETKAVANAPAKDAAKDDTNGAKPFLNLPPEERPQEKITLPAGEKDAQASLNESLGERRRQIDERAKELDMRENLVNAAEKKLQEETTDLKKIQDAIEANKKSNEEAAGGQIKSIVTMYETMKPKDAARVFDKLDMATLIEIVDRMNPKVTATILSQMSPEMAQKLTVELARRSMQKQREAQMQMQPLTGGVPPAANAPAALAAPASTELPRIDQPAKH